MRRRRSLLPGGIRAGTFFTVLTLAASVGIPYTYALDAPELFQLDGDIEGVHDPAIIREGDTYYLFSTGPEQSGHIPMRCSTDLRHWHLCGRVFEAIPAWAAAEIPGVKTLWAPDISFYQGQYRLYYAASTFGRNDSAIGLATNRTLNPESRDYKWIDRGLVLRSRQGTDDWNAIDPNLVTDRHHRQWLAYGSYWSGIKMRRIDPATGKLSTKDETQYALAERPRGPGSPGAIEAPFIIWHKSWYYLFASFDFCCRGAQSNYYVVAGRSHELTGPYLDAAGKPMLQGGGTLLVEGTSKWRGPGHEAVLLQKPWDIMVFHTYDGVTGRRFLQISSVTWGKDWPHVAKLPSNALGDKR